MLKTCLVNPLFTERVGRTSERYFVRSGSRWPSSYVKPAGRPGHYLPFPFFLAYAAALLRRDSFPIAVRDAVAANLSLEELAAAVRREGPDLIFFEMSTPTATRDLDLARRLKHETGAEIALGGPHATEFAEEILTDQSGVDYVLLYEYELTLRELVSRMSAGHGLAGVPGIAYRQGGEVRVQREYRPIDPLDQLPPPARDLFPANDLTDPGLYWDGFCQHRPAIQMHSSRGCPFRCDFCLWVQVMYRDGRYRTFSVSRVVDEMQEAVARYGAREIYFDDDDFTVSREHVLGLCREIRARGLRVPWSCMGDPVVPDGPMLDAMADAGCVGLKFGLESAAPHILARLGKPVDLDRVKRLAAGCSRRRIKTHATVAFGLWDETHRTMADTLSFVSGLDVDSIQFSIACPFPGTRYFQELRRTGRLVSSAWERYDGARHAVLAHVGLSAQEIETFCSQAPRRWLAARVRSPGWLLRQARYALRIAKGQGLSGLAARAGRACEIFFRRTG